VYRPVMVALGLLAFQAAPALAQRVQAVKLVHPERSTTYKFEPSTVTASPGDVLVFEVESGGPYMVAFQPADFSAPALALMIKAVPGANPELRGPTLRAKGDSFRVTLPSLPPGEYRFYSVTHVAYRMAGTLTVR
jgi:plastocyanin